MSRPSDELDVEGAELAARLDAVARAHGLVVSPLGEVDTVAAAVLIGCAPHTLENQRCNGNGPEHVHRGGRVRYRLVDLADWLLR